MIGLAVAYASAIRTHLSVHGTAHPMLALDQQLIVLSTAPLTSQMAGSEIAARFLPGDKTLRAAGNPYGGAAAQGSRKFQDAGSPHSPARRIAPSTPRARNRAASSSEDGAAQGGVRAQALVPLYACTLGSYQPRAPPRPEPLHPVRSNILTKNESISIPVKNQITSSP